MTLNHQGHWSQTPWEMPVPTLPRHHELHLPLIHDPCLQLRKEELPVEAIDGGDVREDACGDFRRDPCFHQSGAENLGTEKPMQWSLSVGHCRWLRSCFCCRYGSSREAAVALCFLSEPSTSSNWLKEPYGLKASLLMAKNWGVRQGQSPLDGDRPSFFHLPFKGNGWS